MIPRNLQYLTITNISVPLNPPLSTILFVCSCLYLQVILVYILEPCVLPFISFEQLQFISNNLVLIRLCQSY